MTSDGVAANAEALAGLVGDAVEAIAKATNAASAAVTRHQHTTIREALAAAEKASKAAAGHSLLAIRHFLTGAKRCYEFLVANYPRADDTLGAPIDFSSIGRLWPEGEPEWFKEAKEPSGDAELVIEIEVPEGVSDEEVVRSVGELALHCDDLHRALGGNGLRIEASEIGTLASEPVGGVR